MAQGHKDGQDLPLAAVELVTQQIARAVELPVSIDFEGAYASSPEHCAANTLKSSRSV
jgi:2-methylisocitrate lyase-like PEP mutase family enzyme